MIHSGMLLTLDKMQLLSERLSLLASVSKFDRPGEREADTLAHALMDIEASSRKILDELLPKILNESLTTEQLNDVLLAIGEEFRHVLYHIKDPQFFRYLLGD